MKKVLIFSLAYHPHIGGAEIAIKEITDRIQDIEFHLITLRFSKSDSPEKKLGNVVVHRVGLGSGYLSKMFFVIRAAFAGKRLHKELNFDGAWAMMSYMLIPIVLMRFMRVHIPYALTLQEGDTYQHMFGRLRILPFLPLISAGFKNAKVVQTISTFLADWARAQKFDGPIEIISNGVDFNKFSQNYTEKERGAMYSEIVKTDGDVFLITTSRLVIKNAVDDVIRALKSLPVNYYFLIIGEGPEEGFLRTLVSENGLDKRVTFKGHVSHGEIPKYLRACDIFVRPSRSEGMGNSFIEAMAASLPIIATQEGGIADFLFDEKRNPNKPTTGWVVDKNSPDQIAYAAKDIANHPEKVQKVTATAKQMVMEKYDWNFIARDMREKVFARLF